MFTLVEERRSSQEEKVAELMVVSRRLDEETKSKGNQLEKIESVTKQKDERFNTLTERITESEAVSNNASFIMELSSYRRGQLLIHS